MGTLVFACPTTWHQVSTGIEMRSIELQKPAEDKDIHLCPRCRNNHLLSRIWAWLDSNDPRSW